MGINTATASSVFQFEPFFGIVNSGIFKDELPRTFHICSCIGRGKDKFGNYSTIH